MRQQKDKQLLEDTKQHEQNLRMQVSTPLNEDAVAQI